MKALVIIWSAGMRAGPPAGPARGVTFAVQCSDGPGDGPPTRKHNSRLANSLGFSEFVLELPRTF